MQHWLGCTHSCMHASPTCTSLAYPLACPRAPVSLARMLSECCTNACMHTPACTTCIAHTSVPACMHACIRVTGMHACRPCTLILSRAGDFRSMSIHMHAGGSTTNLQQQRAVHGQVQRPSTPAQLVVGGPQQRICHLNICTPKRIATSVCFIWVL
jgi:hypothetical protein